MSNLKFADPSGHLPANYRMGATWCIKCGRAIVYRDGKWVLQYPNPDCEPEIT